MRHRERFMTRLASMKSVVVAGGCLVFFAAPQAALCMSSEPGAAPPAPMDPGTVPRGRSAAPPDLLEGLTLAEDEKAKIARIRHETKARLAAMESDTALSPEAADAMRRGYVRLENSQILEALTPQQQQQVRKRIAAWRAAKGKSQYPLRRASVSDQTPQAQQ